MASLPAHRDWTQHPPQQTTPREPGTVLIIDDDAGVRKIVELLLARAGHRVLTASDGRAGITLFREQRATIRLVLLDVQMPGLDGPATLAELRQLESALPCCFMSGYSGAYTEAALAALGAAFLSKPFQPDALLHTVARLLGARVLS